MNTDLTTKVINILQNCPQCMTSVKQVPCEDYNARFGALIRVKYGIITTTLIDWATVAQTINSQL
jgi:hypothetical protein